MSHDSPSPEMLQMRADVILRMKKANEIVEKALGKVQKATIAIENSSASAGTSERDNLYKALKDAQEAYLATYEEQKIAYSNAASYFEPINS